MKTLRSQFTTASYNKHNIPSSIARAIRWLQKTAPKGTPIIVGIAGPSRSGKSTLVAHLVRLLHQASLRVLVHNQDKFFIPQLAKQKFSGHHPRSRERKSMHAFLQNAYKRRDIDIVLCYSNAALLFPKLRKHYSLTIGAITDTTTLLIRRLHLQLHKPSLIIKHFSTKTLPDIKQYTLPSLAHADLLYITDQKQNELRINKRILTAVRGQQIFTALSIDDDGWNKLWENKTDRFTNVPSSLCKHLINTFPLAGKTVVEIGPGGTPRDACRFIDHGARYIGIEISRAATRSAARLLRFRNHPITIATTHSTSRLASHLKQRGNIIICSDIIENADHIFSALHHTTYLTYAHSSLHYFPDHTLIQLLKTILKHSKYIALSVKTKNDATARRGALHATFRDGRIYENSFHRQIRFFRNEKQLMALIKHLRAKIIYCHTQRELFDAKKSGDLSYAEFFNVIFSAT